MDSGDTVWVLASAAMVFLMTPGVALFYGGMARRKNILSILMQCFIVMCLIGVQWVIYGYSIAFGPDIGHGIIGSLDWAGLKSIGLGPHPDYGSTIPHPAFMIFQAMFAVLTPALIVGAVAERIRFSAFTVFMLLWATFVYDPIAHWVWATGGWLKKLGALDFAGGIVVHVSSGISALVMAVLIGKRLSFDKQAFAPHNLPITVLGGGLLWFGWFGFNAGSALAAGGIAANAFMTTNISAAAAGLTWALIEWQQQGAPTVLGIVTGAVAGLVSITPACGFVGPLSAIAIGILGGILSYLAVTALKPKVGYDDSLDVFGVHGIGGMWGTLATGLFAQEAINETGSNGLFFGNAALFLIQGLYLLVCLAYAAAMTWMLFVLVDALVGMRVTREDEMVGLDLAQHHEAAYTVLE
jgi:ammonium transporter, Amt family